MRRYLLDTGPLTGLLFNRPHVVTRLRPWLTDQEAATSVLVYGEITHTLIAATALEHHLTVVTMDDDFSRVRGLDVLLLPRS